MDFIENMPKVVYLGNELWFWFHIKLSNGNLFKKLANKQNINNYEKDLTKHYIELNNGCKLMVFN